MKKIYVLFLTAAVYSGISAQQMEFRLLPDDASRLYDVNSDGKAIFSRGYYDYVAQTTTFGESGVEATNKFNNLGDVAGDMDFVAEDGSSLGQAAYRKNGVWTAIGYFPGDIPGNSWFSSSKAISENSKYVTGQISVGVSGSYPFIYNTETNTLTKLTNGDDLWEYGRGSGINDAGYVAGFVDREDIYNTGTFWVPAYFDPTGNLHYIDLTTTNMQPGEANDISNSGIVAGYKGNKAFIYNINTSEYKSFDPPTGFSSVSFTSVSENGVAVGFAGEFPNRETVIYHPSLGNNPILLKDVLTQNNLTIGTYDDKLGTGMGISSDGNWVAGFGNVEGAPFFAKGWMANFKGLLLDSNDCKILVPDNIVTTIDNPTQSSKIINYTAELNCQSSSSAGLTMVMVKGLASGSAFPIGTTDVVYHLVDADGKVHYTASFKVTVNDLYCTSVPYWGGGMYDSITKVQYAGIDNSSAVGTGVPAEYFLDKVAEVRQGETKPLNIEALTSGATEKISLFIDWNQNGLFTDAGEMYEVGDVTSTFDENWNETPATISKDITTPVGALLGTTRMRIVMKYGNNTDTYVTNPCDTTEAGDFLMGQTEDYMVNVKEYLATDNPTLKAFSYYPNPVTDILNISSTNNISSVSVYSADGKLISNQSYSAKSTTIKSDLSKLKTGIYLVKANLTDGSQKDLKIIKK